MEIRPSGKITSFVDVNLTIGDFSMRYSADTATCGQIPRSACELFRTSSRAVTPEEEDDSGPPISLRPTGRKVEIYFQIALPCRLICDDDFVVVGLKVGIDWLQGRAQAGEQRQKRQHRSHHEHVFPSGVIFYHSKLADNTGLSVNLA